MKSQKSHLNKIRYLIFIFVFLSVIFIPNVKATVNPTVDFYVNDYANILSNETKEYIMNKSKLINNADGTQIVVVTVKTLEGNSIEDYAVDLFRKFKIGDSKKNNGILLLISTSDRALRIEVGYGLEGIINDGKAGRIRDEMMIPYLKNNDWNNGIKNGYDAIYSEIVKGNNLNIEYTEPQKRKNTEGYFEISLLTGAILGLIARAMKHKNIFTTIYVILWLLIFNTFKSLAALLFLNLIIYILIAYFSSRSRFYTDSGYGGFGGSSFGGGFSGGGGSTGGGGASGHF